MNVYLQRIFQIVAHILVIDSFSLISASTFYHRNEGGHVILTFHHGQSRDCMFLLSFDETSFNNNGSELSSEAYPHSKHLRTTIKTIARDRSLTVSLRINSLIATDSGHYTCLFNCHDQVLSRIIRLQVHYPPQAAVCTWTDSNIPMQNSSSNSPSALQCTAKRGSPEGTVICYSKSEHGSQAYTPSKVDIVGDDINARFWLKWNSFVKCCSQNSYFLRQYRDCNDFSQRHQEIHSTGQDLNKDRTDTQLGFTILSHNTPTSAASISTPENTAIAVFPFFKEGEEAELIFQYEFDKEVDFSLIKGNPGPFYEEGHLVRTALTESQLTRFSVTTDFKKSIPLLTIKLTINEVRREEAGTYVCNIIRNHETQEAFTKRISLKVEFPPGNASCTIRSSNHVIDPVEGWALLSCSAMLGSHPSCIQCYQKGVMAPPWLEQFRNTTSIVHNFWIRTTEPVFCCSSAYHEEAIERVNCKDFIWEPTHTTLTEQAMSGEIKTKRPSVASFKGSSAQNSVPIQQNDEIDKLNYIITAIITTLVILIPIISFQLNIISSQIRKIQKSFDKNIDEKDNN